MADENNSSSRYSPVALRLAERYGISPDAVEAIISGTRQEFTSAPNMNEGASEDFEQPSIVYPPVAPPEAEIEKAAAVSHETSNHQATTNSSDLEAASVASTLRNHDHGDASHSTPVSKVPKPVFKMEPVKKAPTNSGLTTAMITVLLIVIGTAIAFQRGCFRQRHEHTQPASVDTIQNMLNEQDRKASSAPEPTDVVPPTVPPEALAVPNGETAVKGNSPADKPASAAPAKKVTPAKKAASKPAHTTASTKAVLETTSNLDAEERLAELRAAGHSKARMETVHKGASTIYRVREK